MRVGGRKAWSMSGVVGTFVLSRFRVDGVCTIAKEDGVQYEEPPASPPPPSIDPFRMHLRKLMRKQDLSRVRFS